MTKKTFLKLILASSAAIATGAAFMPSDSPVWECPWCKNPELLEPKGNPETWDDVCQLMSEKITMEIDHEILHQLMNSPIICK